MDKLVKKFNTIISHHGEVTNIPKQGFIEYYDTSGECAELTKQIAIDFAEYVGEFKDIEFDKNRWTIFVDAEGEYFPVTYTTEDLFEMFLEEYDTR